MHPCTPQPGGIPRDDFTTHPPRPGPSRSLISIARTRYRFLGKSLGGGIHPIHPSTHSRHPLADLRPASRPTHPGFVGKFHKDSRHAHRLPCIHRLLLLRRLLALRKRNFRPLGKFIEIHRPIAPTSRLRLAPQLILDPTVLSLHLPRRSRSLPTVLVIEEAEQGNSPVARKSLGPIFPSCPDYEKACDPGGRAFQENLRRRHPWRAKTGPQRLKMASYSRWRLA